MQLTYLGLSLSWLTSPWLVWFFLLLIQDAIALWILNLLRIFCVSFAIGVGSLVH